MSRKRSFTDLVLSGWVGLAIDPSLPTDTTELDLMRENLLRDLAYLVHKRNLEGGGAYDREDRYWERKRALIKRIRAIEDQIEVLNAVRNKPVVGASVPVNTTEKWYPSNPGCRRCLTDPCCCERYKR